MLNDKYTSNSRKTGNTRKTIYNVKGELRRWRSPQLDHPVLELRHDVRCRRGEALRGGDDFHRLPVSLNKIVQAKEGTIKAVVVVMMSLFYMSDTLLAVVMGVNCLVMHMQRRQHHHWQITGQQ